MEPCAVTKLKTPSPTLTEVGWPFTRQLSEEPGAKGSLGSSALSENSGRARPETVAPLAAVSPGSFLRPQASKVAELHRAVVGLRKVPSSSVPICLRAQASQQLKVATNDPSGPDGRWRASARLHAPRDEPAKPQGRQVLSLNVPQTTVLGGGLEGPAAVPNKIAGLEQSQVVGPCLPSLVLDLTALVAQTVADDDRATKPLSAPDVSNEAITALGGLDGPSSKPSQIKEAARVVQGVKETRVPLIRPPVRPASILVPSRKAGRVLTPYVVEADHAHKSAPAIRGLGPVPTLVAVHVAWGWRKTYRPAVAIHVDQLSRGDTAVWLRPARLSRLL